MVAGKELCYVKSGKKYAKTGTMTKPYYYKISIAYKQNKNSNDKTCNLFQDFVKKIHSISLIIFLPY